MYLTYATVHIYVEPIEIAGITLQVVLFAVECVDTFYCFEPIKNDMMWYNQPCA